MPQNSLGKNMEEAFHAGVPDDQDPDKRQSRQIDFPVYHSPADRQPVPAVLQHGGHPDCGPHAGRGSPGRRGLHGRPDVFHPRLRHRIHGGAGYHHGPALWSGPQAGGAAQLCRLHRPEFRHDRPADRRQRRLRSSRSGTAANSSGNPGGGPRLHHRHFLGHRRSHAVQPPLQRSPRPRGQPDAPLFPGSGLRTEHCAGPGADPAVRHGTCGGCRRHRSLPTGCGPLLHRLRF